MRSLLPHNNNSESSRWEDSSLIAAIDDNDLLAEEKVRDLAAKTLDCPSHTSTARQHSSTRESVR